MGPLGSRVGWSSSGRAWPARGRLVVGCCQRYRCHCRERGCIHSGTGFGRADGRRLVWFVGRWDGGGRTLSVGDGRASLGADFASPGRLRTGGPLIGCSKVLLSLHYARTPSRARRWSPQRHRRLSQGTLSHWEPIDRKVSPRRRLTRPSAHRSVSPAGLSIVPIGHLFAFQTHSAKRSNLCQPSPPRPISQPWAC